LLQLSNAFRLRSGCLRGHLRLTAATALLKLAILADNEKEISNSAFETVAYVVQVSMASSSKRQSTLKSTPTGSLLPSSRSIPDQIAQTPGAETECPSVEHGTILICS
jgi:hypothetical protein